jgi:glutamate-ammonia-ligase adenylyltransferase
LSQIIDSFVYQSELLPSTVKELAHIRHRMEVELGKESGDKQFHLKAGVGGLVDVEFATQLLQLKHGHHAPELKTPNTLAALGLLRKKKLITAEQYKDFTRGYEFLRQLENRIRLASQYGVAVIARTPKSLIRLARLSGGGGSTPDKARASKLEKQYLATTEAIRKAYKEILAQLV